MRIRYLDGRRLKRALIAGSRRVQQYREQLNSINVFPVADGDTGTNMAGTFRAMVGGLRSTTRVDLEEVSRSAADASLRGARGNSGTIVSQFFFGLALGSRGKKRIDTRTFSSILNQAVDYTYQALAEPVEGTILTVLRRWSHKVADYSRRTDDFVKLFSESLETAKTALRDTIQQLPSLRKAKVVDAGALGFVHFIEGILRFIEGGTIRELEEFSAFEEINLPQDFGSEEEITYRYCTECVIRGQAIDLEELKRELGALGDSLIVAGSDQLLKVHIHTDDPEELFFRCEKHGLLEEQKADDMHKQYLAAHTPHLQTALVVDSAGDLPEELLAKSFVHLVPVKLIYGERTYLDRVALSPRRYYQLLAARGERNISTSQPAPGEFEKTFSFLSAHYKDVIYLSLASVLSGTMKSAQSALERVSRAEDIHIIDSTSVTVGIALIARRLAEAIEKQTPIDEIRQLAEKLSRRVRLLIHIPSLEALLRSGRLGRTKGLIARMLKLRPVLTLDQNGRVVKAAMVKGAEAGKQKIISLIRSQIGDHGTTDFAIAHVDDLETVEWFLRELLQRFQPEREIFIRDASPALATHTGFGTVAVAYFAHES
ncbi:MAG TPA: DegV family EDD domain-containing protein [Sediminispirochaeta sp.]|nr:DegV family EDD domain-containing protein [Sediminispirochaeta sp.]